MYDEHSGNHPTIHCNRFPSWDELTQLQRDEWMRKAGHEPCGLPLDRIEAPTGQPARAWTAQEKIDCAAAMKKIVEREQEGEQGLAIPSAAEFRLRMGEMSAEQVRIAKAAYRMGHAAATLTQQQGGEQEAAWQNIETAEVEFLNNLAEKGGLADPVPGMLRHCARLIAGKRPAVVAPDRYETEEEGDAYAHGYVDGEDAALRTKQPAASEGVDSEICMRLVQLVEGGGLTWRDSSGNHRLKDTPDWVAFYCATNNAREREASAKISKQDWESANETR